MATTIKLKNGSGAPLAGDLVQGEPALDLTNKRLYTEDSGGTVIEVGTNPTSLTTTTVSATGSVTGQKLVASDGLLELDDNGTHNGIINVPASLFINIDSDNTNTGEDFVIAKDRTSASGGTELFRVQEDGNVGIGTASPSTSLDVVRAGAMPLRVQSTSGTECQINMVNTGGNVQLEAHSGNFTIDADNVGIGTTSPVRQLSIEKNGTALASLVNTAGGSCQLLFGDSVSDTQGRVLYDNNGDYLTLYANGAERMRIDSSGNVGIGTTTPNSAGLGANGQTLQLSSRTFIATDASGDTVLGGLSGSNFTAFYQGGTERMRIDVAGRVLIGSTTADGRLKISAASGSAVAAELTLWGNNGSAFGSTNIAKSKIDSVTDGTAYGSNMRFYTNDTSNNYQERMRIDSSGRTLIGTTVADQDAKLTVVGSGAGGSSPATISGNTVATFRRTGGLSHSANVSILGGSTGFSVLNLGDRDDEDVGRVYYDHTNNAMLFDTNATERMRIDSSGNLLVGRTSTPSGIQAGSLCINFDIHHQDAAGNDRLLYDRSANLLGNTGTNVTCVNLSKSSGSFKIDHPLPEKTDTHHLVHSFVEAPQADNIYRGTVSLVDGTATVNLDTAGRMSEGTFVLLNTNVQCFTANESGWTAVKGSVSENVLTITAQEACGDTVSWMVVGERCDQHILDTEWTDENGRVIVEPLKGA